MWQIERLTAGIWAVMDWDTKAENRGGCDYLYS